MLCAKSLQSCLTPCDPMDCSPSGSSVHGILQARTLEWVAMPSSRGSSRPRDQSHGSYLSCFGSGALYHWCHLGNPIQGRKIHLLVSEDVGWTLTAFHQVKYIRQRKTDTYYLICMQNMKKNHINQKR